MSNSTLLNELKNENFDLAIVDLVYNECSLVRKMLIKNLEKLRFLYNRNYELIILLFSILLYTTFDSDPEDSKSKI